MATPSGTPEGNQQEIPLRNLLPELDQETSLNPIAHTPPLQPPGRTQPPPPPPLPFANETPSSDQAQEAIIKLRDALRGRARTDDQPLQHSTLADRRRQDRGKRPRGDEDDQTVQSAPSRDVCQDREGRTNNLPPETIAESDDPPPQRNNGTRPGDRSVGHSSHPSRAHQRAHPEENSREPRRRNPDRLNQETHGTEEKEALREFMR
ncbi:hypothetical protein COLO4_16267 [Corchorus olitorius]|uniref:Uncharacterized protein n=1 Tax=Corchorus olitorius TaxID=93759 RepID=A0A1R3JIC5_9ROSI|nr:hypothetical protein COLO4_16267 [Corchorus olitorius]